MLKRLKPGLLAALLLGAAPAVAQTGPGIVMAAFGGGNGETWRQAMGGPFGRETGLPVRIADLPNVESAMRASAGNPQYNVAWLGYYAAAALHKEGLTEDFDPVEFPALKNVPDKFVMKAANGRLIGIPVQFQYYGIAFNTQEAKAADFLSWTSLGEPRWKGKVAQPQAFIGASYDLPMFAHIAGGDVARLDPGLPEFRRFARNAATVLTSFAQGNTLLSRGEIAAVPFYSARIRALKKEGAPVDITIPKEGAMMLPYMLIVPKGSKNREAVVRFLNYALEAEGQIRMYDFSGYIPMNTAAKLSDSQTAELGMPLPQLLERLYQPDYWKQVETVKAATDLVERIQAER